MINGYEAVMIKIAMIAFAMGMITGALTIPYLKNKRKIDKKLNKIWKKIICYIGIFFLEIKHVLFYVLGIPILILLAILNLLTMMLIIKIESIWTKDKTYLKTINELIIKELKKKKPKRTNK